MNDDASKRAADYWSTDHKKARPVSWIEHPILMRYMHRRATGDPDLPTYEWFRRRYLPRPVDLALSLGCGLGGFERGAVPNFARHFHANDLSPGAIETARIAASEAGLADRIEYSVVNLDQAELPVATYDAVFGLASVHHVTNLEHLFEQCRRALKPRALLFLNEYIGPNRFQTPPEIVAIINDLLVALPPRYRYNLHTDDGTTIDHYTPAPIEHFLAHDPSESVRSADILHTLKEQFDIVEFRPWGGAILHMLLSGIVGNFDGNNENDVAMLQMLGTIEETLERKDVIPSDFAAIVARPRDDRY